MSRELNEARGPWEYLWGSVLGRGNSKCRDPETERNAIHQWGWLMRRRGDRPAATIFKWHSFFRREYDFNLSQAFHRTGNGVFNTRFYSLGLVHNVLIRNHLMDKHWLGRMAWGEDGHGVIQSDNFQKVQSPERAT